MTCPFLKSSKGPTTIQYSNGSEGLNLVIPRIADYDFELEELPELWMKCYPHLYQESTMNAINKVFCSVGYLFAETKKDGKKPYYQGMGTAFQLAPSIIATAMHVIEATNKLKTADADGNTTVQLYYTTARVDIGSRLFGCLVRKNENATPVVEYYEEDVAQAEQVEMFDPLLKKKRLVTTHPDFCLLRLGTPLEQEKYFIPHPRVRIERAEVYVLGVPGKLAEQPPHIDEKRFSLSTLNNHIGNCNKQHISPGHIIHTRAHARHDVEGGRVIAYDCYTHKGNSGSPVVIHTSPELVLGIHQGWSAFPGANIAPPTCDTPFVKSYVRRVIPIVLDGSFHIDQCRSIQLYLDSVKNLLKSQDLKNLVQLFYDKYNNLIEMRSAELLQIELADKEKAKEEELQKKQDLYRKELVASGLTEQDYKAMVAKKEAERREELKNRLAANKAKREQDRVEIEKIRADKRERPGYDVYDFDESPMEERDGEDFLQVDDLSAEEEEALILKMQAQDSTALFLD